VFATFWLNISFQFNFLGMRGFSPTLFLFEAVESFKEEKGMTAHSSHQTDTKMVWPLRAIGTLVCIGILLYETFVLLLLHKRRDT
jgi:hypothetical protein